VPDPVHPGTRVEALDHGVAVFTVTASGALINPRLALGRFDKRLTRLQRKLARQKKFSNNWRKTKKALNALHHRIARARRDFLHKLSTALSKHHALIVVEDLRLKNMTASARGTVEEPGCNVAAKAGLNRALLGQGFGEFNRQLDYKLERLGGRLVKVPPQYTSQRCSRCGHTHAENRVSRDRFACTACGVAAHADVNAAANILLAGLIETGMSEAKARAYLLNEHTAPGRGAVLPVEGSSVSTPSKQEPWEVSLVDAAHTTTSQAFAA
jgi:putative transposase